MAQLKSIRPGDIVEVRGEFKADVMGRAEGKLQIRPIGVRISRYSCTARDVTKHWKLTKNAPKPRARKDDDRT